MESIYEFIFDVDDYIIKYELNQIYLELLHYK